MTFTEKYRPNNLSDVVGNEKIVTYLKSWALSWTNNIITKKEKTIILYGKPGIGKTSVAYALANQMGWDIVELNASDTRTGSTIQKIAGAASKSGTFDDLCNKRLIIIDEADNLYGNSDRGGTRAISNLIDKTKQPIIIIANNIYGINQSIKSKCNSFQFTEPSRIDILKIIDKICLVESISLDKQTKDKIISVANGDIRSVVNTLEASCLNKENISVDDINVDSKDTTIDIFKFINEILKTSNTKDTMFNMTNIGETLDSVAQWVDENIPLVYTNVDERFDAYDILSKSDMFMGRVNKRQNYSFWKYASFLSTCGVQSVKNKNYSGFTRFQFPNFRKQLSDTKTERQTKKGLLIKLSNVFHLSTKHVNSELFWFFRYIFKDSNYAIILSYELKLTKDELALLLDAKSDSDVVKKIYDITKELTEENIDMEEAMEEAKQEIKEINKVVEEKGTQKSIFDY